MTYFHNMQDLTSDCGLAVVKSLLEYYNRFQEERFEIIVSNADINQGLSLFDIENILENFGIEGNCYEVEDIFSLSFDNPLILVINNDGKNHYSLAYGVENNKIIISDPLNPLIERVEFDEVASVFMGYIFRVEKLLDFTLNDVSFLKRFNNFKSLSIRSNLFFLTTLLWVIPIMIIFSIQYLLIYQMRNLEVWQIIVALIFEILLIGIYLKSKVDYEIMISEEVSLTQEKLTFSFLNEIDNISEREDNIYNRLVKFWNNFNSSDWLLKRYQAYLELFYAVAMLCIVFIFSKELALLTLICVSCFGYLFYKGIKKRKNFNKAYFNSMGALSIFVEESIHNKLDRTIFSNSKEITSHLKRLLLKIKLTEFEQNNSKTLLLALYDGVMYTNLLLIFSYVMMMYFLELDFRISNAFISFVIVYMIYNLGKPILQKLLELERYSSLKPSSQFMLISEDDVDSEFKITKISLNNVSVKYDLDKPVSILNGLTKEVETSSLTLIKGKNGIGKSTLMQVIMGTISISQGEISYFDSKGILSGYSKSSIQSKMSYYHPNQFLNYASIRKNIGYDIYNESESEVDNIFNLELDKVVFYNGINLSQGERQKVLLSRALNKKADIYIFDEPSSNLDDESKKIFIDKIVNLKKQAMVFIVTHDSHFEPISDDTIIIK